MKKGSCECIKGSLKGPCKHKASIAKEYKVKNFEILPEDNQEMRSFYHFLGTGNKKEASWFRPIQEEASLPLVDQKILQRGIQNHTYSFCLSEERTFYGGNGNGMYISFLKKWNDCILFLLELNESISFLQEWNEHSIPVGMKCSLHSSRNGMR